MIRSEVTVLASVSIPFIHSILNRIEFDKLCFRLNYNNMWPKWRTRSTASIIQMLISNRSSRCSSRFCCRIARSHLRGTRLGQTAHPLVRVRSSRLLVVIQLQCLRSIFQMQLPDKLSKVLQGLIWTNLRKVATLWNLLIRPLSRII